MSNNVLTASRQSCLKRCMRAHYWQFEIGLRKTTDSGQALRFGSAWHRAMEARWNGADWETAFQAAINCASDQLDEYTCASLAGLLTGYYVLYGVAETYGNLCPEVEFSFPLRHSRKFSVAGKIDSLGTLTDGREALIESKTTGDSIEAGSDYWLRLRFNGQVLQYILAARQLGRDLSEVVYDVVRKPSIRPKHICDLDSNGKKIVVDREGRRVLKKNGEPRESASEADGWIVKGHIETPHEYNARLSDDTIARPEFYFARREIPIIEEELAEFENERLASAQIINFCRKQERKMAKPEQAWPRSVTKENCKFCTYAPFCLASVSPDLQNPPEGFEVGIFNPELDTSTTEEKETASEL